MDFLKDFFTCVSVRLSALESSIRFATERYLFLANSPSRRFICSGVKAVRGRFFGTSSSLLLRAVVGALSERCRARGALLSSRTELRSADSGDEPVPVPTLSRAAPGLLPIP